MVVQTRPNVAFMRTLSLLLFKNQACPSLPTDGVSVSITRWPSAQLVLLLHII